MKKTASFMNNQGSWSSYLGLPNPADADLHQNTPLRTPQTHPYSYDPFTVWGGPDESCNGSVYTDRMSQWDYQKYSKLGQEVFGNQGEMRWFTDYGPEAVEKFMRLYFGNETVKLTRIVEYCNLSTGYPLWRLDYHSEPAED